jgi:tetratricopeptide (TPR) repeat protein
MKNKKPFIKITPSVFALIFSAFTSLSAQRPMKIKHSCNFAAAETEGQLYTYDASREAEGIIKDIMDAYSLPQNFVVKSADCKNALATTEGKQRYILYSTAFLENFKQEANTKWAAYCVLAHEIGHHLSNHDLEETDPSVRKRFELEADRFAGGVLFKMGATLVQTQAGINTFSLEGESTTHPSKRARLEAIAVGWKKAEETANKSGSDNVDINSDEHKLYKKALEIAPKDKTKAIEWLDKAIEINPNFAEAFTRRADYKWTNDDKEGAKEDLEEAIRLNKNAYEAFAMRGIMRTFESKFVDAFKDLNAAIRINKDFADAYYYRAIAFQIQKQMDFETKMLADLEKTLKIDPKHHQAYEQRGRWYYEQAEFEKAIEDFTKALETMPEPDAGVVGLRAAAYMSLKKYSQALSDFDKEEQLLGKDFKSYNDYAQCLHSLGKTREAVAYLDKYIALAPVGDSYAMSAYFNTYLYRGIYKALLKQETEAETDFQAALKTKGRAWGMDYQKIGCTLVDNNLWKLAVPYLQKAVEMQGESSPNSKACLETALKNVKN